MKKVLLVAICMAAQTCLAQTGRPSLEEFIDDAVIQGSIGPRAQDTLDNYPFVYSIAFLFDKYGSIDTVYFSSKVRRTTRERCGLDGRLLPRMKASNIKYPEYASKMVLAVFYYYYYKDKVADYKSGVLEDLANLLPEAAMGRPIVVLRPFVNQYSYIAN